MIPVLPANRVTGQTSNTLYHMYGIPQTNHLNPAFQPMCNFHLGLPGVSPFQFNFENNALSFSDVIYRDPVTDSLITFMHPNGDKEKFLDGLRNKNSFIFDMGTDLLSIGFRVENFFLSLDITERMDGNFSFPKDLVEFGLYGAGDGDVLDFSGIGFRATWYREFAIGLSVNLNDRLYLGARPKFLFGKADVRTEITNMTINTGLDAWDVRTEAEVLGSLPFLDLYFDQEGYLDSIDSEYDFGEKWYELVLNNDNKGFAIDVGAMFRPSEWFTLSASLVDFGSIHWKRDVYRLEEDASYSFEGIEVSLEEDFDPMENLLDTLEQIFKPTGEVQAYKRSLSGKIYLGGALNMGEKARFGVLSGTRFYEGTIRQQFTFSANVMPIRLISASLSYSIMNGTYDNLGFGLSLKPGPFNFYLITDQALGGGFWPQNLRGMNLRVGFNLMFGCNRLKRELKDRPLIE